MNEKNYQKDHPLEYPHRPIRMELMAFTQYCLPECSVAYWRSASGLEVDFIVGDRQLAVEVKGAPRVHEGDLRHLRAFREEWPVRRCAVICLEPQARKTSDGIQILPYDDFLQRLWNKEWVR